MVILNASEQYIKRLLSSFTETQVVGTHYNLKDFKRRYTVWKKNNFAEDDRDILKDFFLEWDLKHIELNLDDVKLDHFKSARVFIERNGKYINYQTAETNDEARKLEEEARLKKKREEEHQQKLRKQAQLEKERLEVQREEIRLKMVELRQNDQLHLDKKSAYLR